MTTGSYINVDGFQRMTLAERVTYFEDLWLSVFPGNLDLDPESPDGQIIGILAQTVSNCDELAETIFNSLANPSGATGKFLTNLLKLNGLARKAGGYSSATCIVQGAPGKVIPTTALARCSAISDQTVTFSPSVAITIGSNGTAQGVFTCNTMGAYAVPSGALNQILSVISGWDALYNPSDGTKGFLVETDERARLRRYTSVGGTPSGMTDAMRAHILDKVPNASRARVWENDGSVPLVIPGGGVVPSKSMLALVEGGTDYDVARAIWQKKALGAGTYGDVAVDVANAQGTITTINFSRPVPVDVYIVLAITTKEGWPSDGVDQIIASILAESVGTGNVDIGGDARHQFSWSDIAKWATMVPGFSILSLGVGTSSSPPDRANLDLAYNEEASLDASRISVSVVA